jgi:hypothetical protein
MSTVLTTPKHLGQQVESIGRALVAQGRSLQETEQLFRAMQADGESPGDIETRLNNIFEGMDATLRRYGAELGNESTAGQLPMTWAKEWRAGSPASLNGFRTGATYANVEDLTLLNAAQGARVITYDNSDANKDLFSGLAAGDVIRVSGCSNSRNDGRYTVKNPVAARGDNATFGLQNGDFAGATGWTASADWTISGGQAVFADAAGAGTLTQALSSIVSGAAYLIQWDMQISGTTPAGSIIVDIGGDYRFRMLFSDVVAPQTYYLITNAPSTTPTLSFTAAETGGTVGITLDNVLVYGAPAIVTNELFSADVTDDDTVITLERTAA